MVKGKSLTELAAELERQAKSKRDMIVPDGLLSLHAVDGVGIRAAVGTVEKQERFDVGKVAHGQFSEKLGIPKRYYDRMLTEAPDLLATNVNGWLRRSGGSKRLVRVLDGTVRAVLSDRYRPLDNYDLAEAVLPTLTSLPEVAVQSSEVTERRMYLQAVSPRISGEVRKGDVVQAGVVISNSEVGCGSLRVEGLLYRLACLNGMISGVTLRSFHLGSRYGETDNVQEVLSDKTRQLSDAAYWHRVRDVTQAAFNETFFNRALNKLRETTTQEITKKVDEVVELTAARFTFTDGEKDGFLKALVKGGDLTRYGMMNAVTSLANTATDYDRAVELERAGGEIIELDRKDWEALAVA